MSGKNEEPAWKLWVAFALLYVVWGSTYLAIRVAVAVFPPLGLAGLRFVIAGGLPLLWLRARGQPWPARVHWLNACIVGGCLMLGGNGLVSWAEQTISSSLAALLLAATPLWFTLFEAMRPGGQRPSVRAAVGLFSGFIGVLLLIGPENMRQELGAPPLIGMGAVLIASASWAFGTMFSRHRAGPSSALEASALHMFCGGVELVIVSVLSGESWAAKQPDTFNAWVACVYLIVIGSWLGFGSYTWLVPRVSPSKLSTYAYVNPLVAVFLGVWLLDEPAGPKLIVPTLAILSGVVLVQLPARRA
ncbi:MAG TPA: EamA family transporter [Polyangiales bacterium]|nr:EamA family transporter [Polyangiales bacterium]